MSLGMYCRAIGVSFAEIQKKLVFVALLLFEILATTNLYAKKKMLSTRVQAFGCTNFLVFFKHRA